MGKINIAELLKDCPQGMELDCVSYNNVSFDKISDDEKAAYPIFCYITDEEGNRSSISFTENGCESKRYGTKCVIFPKGKTTWEGFVPPCKFKDGDVVASLNTSIYIFTNHNGYFFAPCGLIANHEGKNHYFKVSAISILPDNMRLATEEEKAKLFDAIKANGYKWNEETKTLEKLVRNKFDITTLKPFDKVLVRDGAGLWRPNLFGKDMIVGYRYFTTNGSYKECIPYEGNEHLLGTTDDCDEFYKTWKDE